MIIDLDEQVCGLFVSANIKNKDKEFMKIRIDPKSLETHKYCKEKIKIKISTILKVLFWLGILVAIIVSLVLNTTNKAE